MSPNIGTMGDRSVDSKSFMSSGAAEQSQRDTTRSNEKEWRSDYERSSLRDDDGDDDASGHSDEGSYNERSGSYDTDYSRSVQTFDDEESNGFESTASINAQPEESREIKPTNSTETEGRGRSDDETDTCLLSIDEHVRRRRAKIALREYQASKLQTMKNTKSVDSGSFEMRSDDETDTCMLSIEDNVRRRQTRWTRLRNGAEAIDLTCLDSDGGTLEDTTLVEEDEEEEYNEEDEGSESFAESVSVEVRTLGSKTFGTIESAPLESKSPIHERLVDEKRTENWRIKNWRRERSVKDNTSKEKDRALKGVDYMSAFELASTNRDISVVEGGISKKAARAAFEKKEVPDEIPMMLRDDVSSIYPPVRTPIKPYPPKRQPFNGMILEDPIDMEYDEEVGASTKSYEMSIVGSEGKKKSIAAQRSDLELLLIAIISFSLLVLVILLIVILAKNS